MQNNARALGGATIVWLEELPAVVEALCRAWGLTLGATLHGGNSSYVAEAVTVDGQPAVLKVVMPGYDRVEGEIHTLEVAAGRGYARLIAADIGRAALLLERLGAPLSGHGFSVDRQMEVICETLRRAWRLLPEPHGLATGVQKADWHTDFIGEHWDELGRPCPSSVVDLALAFAARRRAAFTPGAAMLLHGDPHEDNTLADPLAPGEFRLVDPDGLVAEPAYDLSVMMRGWTEDLIAGDPLSLGQARCHRLAALAGVAPQPIWEWGLVERVSTGFLLLKLGQEARARDTLRVAEAWAHACA